ncbi:VCBS repeat-containing protein [Pilimelia columellifera]|uniref:Aldos-2-ulose dehydratase beta-propeller domain-containing protein n=1 Tax=Pilimelia columellifera subsp. columellifera TaxID=706583 RepID=A0ABP6AX27_9ACTN
MRPTTTPRFTTTVVDADPQDGYWVQAVDIDGDGRPDLVASGLTRGEVVWYQNPTWQKRVIATLDKPVSLDVADLTGDGLPDLVICHDYGNCMFNCGPRDGKISWLHNPTASGLDGQWTQRPIADLVATHRIRVGQFTSDSHPQLAALPVVGPEGGAAGVASPVRAMVYDRLDNPLSDTPWTGKEIDAQFRIVHGVVAGQFPNTPQPQRDSFLLASAEGITWLGYDDRGRWRHHRLGTGVPPRRSHEFPDHEFSGSGNLAVGTVGGTPYGLIVAVEPFHGDTLAVYLRPPGELTFEQPWQRRQLEVYPLPDATHDAVAHHVVAADFDGDGDDEFLVGLRGPEPTQGVMYYKFDAAGEVLVRERVSAGSVARIAVGDFTGDGRLDFVTTSYDTVGYYEIDDPRITLHVNDFGQPGPAAAPPGGDG